MICYTIIGAPQTGKTTFLREKILKKYKNAIVYDVQNQYSDLPFWKKNMSGLCRISPTDLSFEKFVLLGQALTSTLFVYEESTQFLEGKISQELKANLVGKAHTKNRFVFIFHSFSMCPPRVLDFTDYLVQFSTGISDKEGVMKKGKVANVIACYNKLENLPRFSKFVHRVSTMAKDGIY